MPGMTKYPLLSKLAAIGLVVFLLMLVLARIDWLVSDRRMHQAQALAGVEQSMAGPQTLLGPLLVRQCTEEWDLSPGEAFERRSKTERRQWELVLTPDKLEAGGELHTERLRRGLFRINGFSGHLELQAQWGALAALRAERSHAGSRLQCSPVRLLLALSDVRGLRGAEVAVDGQALPALPGTSLPRFAQGLHVVLPEARAEDTKPLAVRLVLDLLGTGRLALVPAAGETRWALQSDWPHPSFGGRFLPVQREVGAAGFSARWAVSALASSAGADLQRGGAVCPQPAAPGAYEDGEIPHLATLPGGNQPCLDTMGVSLFDPVNPYVLTDRATKYALLFIGLTFGGVALTELLARRRVHPVQYTLVGLALALFFLLLLALSEHLAFGTAYAAAAGACVVLLGWYARHMLGRRRAGFAFGLGVALLYGAMWLLLTLEQNALVVGSLALFVLLAAVMVLTRRVDWHAPLEGWRREGTA